MIELPDDELDKLFRKSSEELDPQYDPEDWNSLKKQLDQHDGKGAAWFKKWWPLGLLLLLIPIGYATYLWKSDNTLQNGEAKVGELSPKPEQLKAERGEAGTVSDDTEKTSPAGKQKANDQAQTEVEVQLPATEKREIALKSQTEKLANKKLVKANKRDFSKPFPKSGYKTAGVESRPLLPRSRSKAGGVYLEPNRSKTEGGDGALILSESGSNNGRNTTDELANSGQNATTSVNPEPDRLAIPAAMLANRPLSWKNKGVEPEIDSVQPDNIPEPEAKKEEVPQAKWAVRFGYSPDLSTVEMKNFTKPGTAVSLLAELSVLPRLFVQTGAVWSRKDYFAEAGSYILPGKWGYDPKPESVDGICKVLEIPLNLRYDIVSGQRSRFFIGSGISSYYMLNEKYKYNYKYPDDPKIKYPSWEGTSGWFLLSHLNASAGYEYRISDKLSLLGEPYARIPLKRVGYGKVNLVTMGFWLSLRYTPAFR
ncbi:hypothetical protein DYBT9623_03611 [Dyadobacter sp. CECT 9623]|uniref:Outer membrane protein beta-barrel domain-containing protein n=1 Tax=Dyadobacter linearis TaxID=2823330 RepID=A0ABN7RC39_9BACT|nr:hypothetical protein [Dyadobacter sp. CECT 9623]CAG5071618.1 hypothetical protein DYBT9623_03611 [Dyadobacter sp. CECT 9623]